MFKNNELIIDNFAGGGGSTEMRKVKSIREQHKMPGLEIQWFP